MRVGLSLFLILGFFDLSGQNRDSLLNQYMFDAGMEILDTGLFSMHEDYLPSGSYWAIDSFTEETVFHRAMLYEQESDSTASYALRIGKGGQMYSLRGVFGESVPPQYRPAPWVQATYGGGTSYAPWVDEVWQMVSVDGSLNNPPDSSYFIHQAGVYLKTPNQQQPFFSPIVGEYYDAASRSYSIINWGQQAHTEDLLNVDHRSGLLYYTKYTHQGLGIIQVDQMIYNFGTDHMNFINVPWGGVRNSSLDHFFISAPDDSYTLANAVYGQGPVVQTGSTGGWMGWSNDEAGNSPALLMVHPQTTVTNNNVFRYGSAGANPNNPRDYNVFEMIRFPGADQLGFGNCMSFRYFYVLGADINGAKAKILAYDLPALAMDAAFTPSDTEVPYLNYQFTENDGVIDAVTTNSSGLSLAMSPFEDSYPVFKILASDSMTYISSDPYFLSEVPYDGHTVGLSLLGFYDKQLELSVQQDTLCSGSSYLFPDGTEMTDIEGSLSYFSIFNTVDLQSDSIVVSNLFVVEPDTAVLVEAGMFIAQSSSVEYQWLDCTADFAQIEGDTFMAFVPWQSGSYAVAITDGICADTSSCYTFVTTAIEEIHSAEAPHVFPNPNTGSFTLSFATAQDQFQFKIYSATGKLLAQGTELYVKEKEFDLRLTPGLYFLEIIRSDERDVRLRLIIE
jgi:hypothetical protein